MADDDDYFDDDSTTSGYTSNSDYDGESNVVSDVDQADDDVENETFVAHSLAKSNRHPLPLLVQLEDAINANDDSEVRSIVQSLEKITDVGISAPVAHRAFAYLLQLDGSKHECHKRDDEEVRRLREEHNVLHGLGTEKTAPVAKASKKEVDVKTKQTKRAAWEDDESRDVVPTLPSHKKESNKKQGSTSPKSKGHQSKASFLVGGKGQGAQDVDWAKCEKLATESMSKIKDMPVINYHANLEKAIDMAMRPQADCDFSLLKMPKLGQVITDVFLIEVPNKHNSKDADPVTLYPFLTVLINTGKLIPANVFKTSTRSFLLAYEATPCPDRTYLDLLEVDSGKAMEPEKEEANNKEEADKSKDKTKKGGIKDDEVVSQGPITDIRVIMKGEELPHNYIPLLTTVKGDPLPAMPFVIAFCRTGWSVVSSMMITQEKDTQPMGYQKLEGNLNPLRTQSKKEEAANGIDELFISIKRNTDIFGYTLVQTLLHVNPDGTRIAPLPDATPDEEKADQEAAKLLSWHYRFLIPLIWGCHCHPDIASECLDTLKVLILEGYLRMSSNLLGSKTTDVELESAGSKQLYHYSRPVGRPNSRALLLQCVVECVCAVKTYTLPKDMDATRVSSLLIEAKVANVLQALLRGHANLLSPASLISLLTRGLSSSDKKIKEGISRNLSLIIIQRAALEEFSMGAISLSPAAIQNRESIIYPLLEQFHMAAMHTGLFRAICCRIAVVLFPPSADSSSHSLPSDPTGATFSSLYANRQLCLLLLLLCKLMQTPYVLPGLAAPCMAKGDFDEGLSGAGGTRDDGGDHSIVDDTVEPSGGVVPSPDFDDSLFAQGAPSQGGKKWVQAVGDWEPWQLKIIRSVTLSYPCRSLHSIALKMMHFVLFKMAAAGKQDDQSSEEGCVNALLVSGPGPAYGFLIRRFFFTTVLASLTSTLEFINIHPVSTSLFPPPAPHNSVHAIMMVMSTLTDPLYMQYVLLDWAELLDSLVSFFLNHSSAPTSITRTLLSRLGKIFQEPEFLMNMHYNLDNCLDKPVVTSLLNSLINVSWPSKEGSEESPSHAGAPSRKTTVSKTSGRGPSRSVAGHGHRPSVLPGGEFKAGGGLAVRNGVWERMESSYCIGVYGEALPSIQALAVESLVRILGLLERWYANVSSNPSSGLAAEEVYLRVANTQARAAILEKGVSMCKKKDMWKAMKLMIAEGYVTDIAEDIAELLHRDNSHFELDKIGDYLGGTRPIVEAPHENEIRMAYIRMLGFRRMDIETALRRLLTESGFRLPPEAQKIERLLECFAAVYMENNPKAMSHDDAGFVAANALVMLNTSLHNPNLKESDRLSLPVFISIMNGVEGLNLTLQQIKDMYFRIKTNQYKIEFKTNNDAAGAPLSANEIHAQFIKDLHIRVIRAHHLMDKQASHDPSYQIAKVKELVEVIFSHIADQLVLAFTCNVNNLLEVRLACACLDGFKFALRLAIRLGLDEEKTSFAQALARSSYGWLSFVADEQQASAGDGQVASPSARAVDLVMGHHLKQGWLIKLLKMLPGDSLLIPHVNATVTTIREAYLSYFSHSHMVQLQSCFPDIELTKSGRLFIREGDVKKINASNKERKGIRLFLFSDCLLFASVSGSSYKVTRVMLLQGITVTEHPGSSCSFKINHPIKGVALIAPSSKAKSAWAAHILQASKAFAEQKTAVLTLAKNLRDGGLIDAALINRLEKSSAFLGKYAALAEVDQTTQAKLLVRSAQEDNEQSCKLCLNKYKLFRKKQTCNVCQDYVCSKCIVPPPDGFPSLPGGADKACTGCLLCLHPQELSFD